MTATPPPLPMRPTQNRTDPDLPVWARRSNPIVRRELGMYWKRLFPNMALLGRLLLAQTVIGVLFPPLLLMNLLYPVAAVGAMVSPLLVFFYARVILTAVTRSAGAMSDAHTQYTIDLLRVSMLSTQDIVLGKAAASLWHRMESLEAVLWGASVGGLTVTTFYYFANLPADAHTWPLRLLALASMWGFALRVLLDPLMLAVVGVAVGTVIHTRSQAVAVTLAGAIAHYAFTAIVVTWWPMPLWAAWIVRVVLPLAVPIAITALSATLACRFIDHDRHHV